MTSASMEQQIQDTEQELAGFAAGSVTAISPAMEQVLLEMRQTGVPCYAWAHLKVLLLAKLQLALDAMDADAASKSRRASVTQLLQTFESPPFTLQRLTEIILEPHRSYRSLPKLLNALEKLLAVSSTIQVVDPRTAQAIVQQFQNPTPLEIDSPIAQPVVVAGADGDVATRAPWSAEAEAAA
ncbi:serine/threonine-protein phosphatase 4 regulatory subunit 2-B-like [Phytophthora cinnamomi]|uniref:serine/threonine-protein phosphatase 4 regulatory subunit 2-B-like n=1 Tax=Phytophthora cinnamomi TaxID=4785 RepID=UPI003559F6A3|nr:serine/threonine-protein phosphatase 4 regulatory subunit 2-B-like [Phytophthora cinnamomi]